MESSADHSDTKKHTFILVHGAWHGGWCWQRVGERLERLGHKVFAPTLTGLCERSHLLNFDVNLTTHIADIVGLINSENLNDIVLVGHSYGGFVISGVAEQAPGKISSIVFLDAFVPDDGQSLVDIVPGSRLTEAIMAAAQNGELAMSAPKAALFHVNELDRAWVDDNCTAHPVAAFTQKLILSGARDRVEKRSYIRGKDYPHIVFDAARERARSTPGWRVYDVASGHDVMIDAPDTLADILCEVA